LAERSRTRRPFVWTLWHPHQKLWNWRLEGAARRIGKRVGAPRLFVAPIVFADSVLLFVLVVARRIRDFGITNAVRLLPPSTRRVLYLDCGVHKRGEQLRCMHVWFGDRCDLQLVGFEASEEHHRDALQNLADLPRLDLRHLALVGPDATDDHVRLYKGSRDGKADSLLREGPRYEVVPAERLSTFLRREYSSYLGDAPVLLRMNIEGSEYDVIDDLVRSGMSDRIDGYFGMWDDVAKLDPARDRAFRRMLKDARITTVTFNDRDLVHPLRRRAVRLAVDASLRAGMRKRPHEQQSASTG
jgi:hypothetical protein